MKTVRQKNVELRRGNSSTVMSSLPTASVDLVICDPPYGTTKHHWDAAPDLAKLLAEFERLLAPGGKIVMFTAQPFTTAVAAAALAAGWKFYEMIWTKTLASNQLSTAWRPLTRHENILILYRDGEARKGYYKPQFTAGNPYRKQRRASPGEGYGSQKKHVTDNEGFRHPTSILHFPNNRKKGEHPTSKPVELLAYLIRQYSAPEGLILDPFMGGGNSAVAAKNEGRQYLGIEINATYFKIAAAKIDTQ